MVEVLDSKLDAVFHALGDLTRRSMLHRLAMGERTVSQLAEPFDMSLAAASKHIKTLENAGLVRREVIGRTHWCHLNAGPMSEANDWLRYYERFWSVRLDRLEELLRLDNVNHPASAPPRQSRGSPPKSSAKRKRGIR